MSGNGQHAAAQADKFGEDNSLSANRSEDDGHGGGDAPTHISGLTEPTGRIIHHGSDGDVSMNDDPPEAWPISETPREHDERNLAARKATRRPRGGAAALRRTGESRSATAS